MKQGAVAGVASPGSLVLPPIAPGPDPAIRLPTVRPGGAVHIDNRQAAARPGFWAGLVAAFTPNPKTEA